MVQLVTDHSPAAAIEMPNINVSDSFTFTHRRFIQHAASGHPVQSTGAVLAVEASQSFTVPGDGPSLMIFTDKHPLTGHCKTLRNFDYSSS